MSEAGRDFDRWAARLEAAARALQGGRAEGAGRDGFKVSAAPCPEHGPGCARVVHGTRAGHFPWQDRDPERLAEHLALAMPPGDVAESPDLPPTAEEVFHRYARRVYGVARRMLGNTADAEDVTKEVLLQVVRRPGTFRGQVRFTTWLDRVTVHATLARRRRARRRERERHLDAPLNGLPGTAAGGVPGQETGALVERAIARMPEMYRDVGVLADVAGLPNAEVGDLLGLTLPAVKSRLHRARLLMCAALAPHRGVPGRLAPAAPAG
jgi:RNA polymerase sigma-70 factor (ECF subfamily)